MKNRTDVRSKVRPSQGNRTACPSSSRSIDSAAGCAQNIDGTLKDASEIVWYNDRDDEAPLSSVPIFQVSSPLPKEKVKPTQRVLDMKNQGAASGIASSLKKNKHNASGSPPKTSLELSRRAKKSTIVVSESDHDEKTDTNINEGSIAVDMGSDLTYAELRAVGDADSQLVNQAQESKSWGKSRATN
ncbi:hypothetical protein BDQ17DRAFT_1434725 [Cyathus striatus]|nr:hypothetical protein BDQ17DRAFT_1434725 [Cyathus striatus]